jgi:hypothetical protein
LGSRQIRIQAATELLALEKESAQRTLSQDEQKRAAELLETIFGDTSKKNYKRKSFKAARIPYSTPAKVNFHNQTIDCKIEDLTDVNFAIASAELDSMNVTDEFKLVSIEIDGLIIPVDIKCVVRRTFKIKGRPAVGAEFTYSNSVATRNAYFHKVFKPILHKYLEQEIISRPWWKFW